MNIKDKLVRDYLQNKLQSEDNTCWIFSNIRVGEYLFEAPSYTEKHHVEKILVIFQYVLLDFKPLNDSIFEELFPTWRKLLKEINIILSVGCPNPYDAFTRTYEGQEYLIFDLIRFNEYKKMGYDIELVIRQIITHEFVHICINNRYPKATNLNYREELEYILFDEGFAHLLSFKEDILDYDFDELIKTKLPNSISIFKQALVETDLEKQKILLEEADSGSYWDKFAAISGKLYLAKNINQLNKLYCLGPKQFMQLIVEESK